MPTIFFPIYADIQKLSRSPFIQAKPSTFLPFLGLLSHVYAVAGTTKALY